MAMAMQMDEGKVAHPFPRSVVTVRRGEGEALDYSVKKRRPFSLARRASHHMSRYTDSIWANDSACTDPDSRTSWTAFPTILSVASSSEEFGCATGSLLR